MKDVHYEAGCISSTCKGTGLNGMCKKVNLKVVIRGSDMDLGTKRARYFSMWHVLFNEFSKTIDAYFCTANE
jgi:hypothetical protein